MSISVSCPSCGALATRGIYEIKSIPIHSCVLLDTAEEARSFPRRDLALAYCDACGFVFNRLFDEQIIRYSTDFEESQHFSPQFSGFAKALAERVARRCSTGGKHILEIGCGKGEFLGELCRVGKATGLGIDPAYRFDHGRTLEVPGVEFIQDYFGPSYEYLEADIILCRHTLEHIGPVSSFVESIRRMIGARDDVWVFFETPDAKRVLAEGAFWDIYYEHCSYFSPGAHARLFRRNGFEVTDLGLDYGDQYIIQFAKLAAETHGAKGGLEDDLSEMKALSEKFPARVEAEQKFWRNHIQDRARAGKRVVLWGGGSKAVAFLTSLGLTDEIAMVIDINPYKQGKFTPGTGHAVVGPQLLADDPPDDVIVMNPIYVNEVRSSLEAMGLAPRIVPLEPTAQ